MQTFISRLLQIAALSLTVSFSAAGSAQAQTAVVVPENGVVKIKSAYSMAETIAKLKKDIADKGIKFFLEVDQSKLAADAGIKINPSTLLIFGNPPLGTLFMKVNPYAGLDWPVRLLVVQDEKGDVYAAYTDFGYIAKRHDVKDMDAEAFKKASGVIASITSSISKK